MTEENTSAYTGYGLDQASMETWVRTRLPDGDASFEDLDERSLRIVEEAIELHQTHAKLETELLRQRLHKLVDTVLGKPVGRPEQEAGGVATTFLAYLASAGLRLDEITAAEIKRIYKVSPEHFKKRTAEKAEAGIGR